jgi:hypothetical protein
VWVCEQASATKLVAGTLLLPSMRPRSTYLQQMQV